MEQALNRAPASGNASQPVNTNSSEIAIPRFTTNLASTSGHDQ